MTRADVVRLSELLAELTGLEASLAQCENQIKIHQRQIEVHTDQRKQVEHALQLLGVRL